MGSPDPRSFSRGKRGIAGSLVFTVFDKDSFYNLKLGDVEGKYSTASANVDENGNQTTYSMDQWDQQMQALLDSGNSLSTDNLEAMYADQIPPFDITITFKNEYGQAATMSMLGVEILNEGSGMSIDDITTEKACTFVARGLTHLKPM
jgi:hypothetical protein